VFATKPDSTTPLQLHLDMLDAVSHDIRGAFGIISGLISVLPFAGNDTEKEDIMYRLQKNSGYAFHMFSVLQDYSLFNSGKHKIEVSDFHPGPIFDGIRKKWSSIISKRNLSFSIQNSHDLYIHSDSQVTKNIAEHIIFSLLNKNKLAGIAVSWSISESGKAVCSISARGVIIPDRTVRIWNENAEGFHWETGDDLSLNVALLMCNKLDIETKMIYNDATAEVGIKLGFILSCKSDFPKLHSK
jgi:K+-sensing histidine kinase KdpD